MDLPEDESYAESEIDSEDSDDSQDDPNFDVLEETQLSFSNLSLKTKTRTRIVKAINDEGYESPHTIECVIPELNQEDRKSYETIQKIIAVGGAEKLKVEQCKIYLRKHGLRLSGAKETLILRIKEHIEIADGGGEKKYPSSSFVLNCKGDACTGDVVMFEQNVYDMFNIASHSGNRHCGTRVVAGRIVKESYGTAKQQHTFTIEVLWSKGEKPLPPLHPLLIKGRNLYRLTTMRQKWENEGVRQKILLEKHARGGAARLSREARMQKKEMRNVNKLSGSRRDMPLQAKQEMAKTGPSLHSQPIKPENNIQPRNIEPKFIPNVHTLPEHGPQRQPLHGITNCSFVQGQGKGLLPVNFGFSYNRNFQSQYDYTRLVGRNHQSYFSNSSHAGGPTQRIPPYKDDQGSLHPLGSKQRQVCRYYAQGACHFGDRCKYLHGSVSNRR